MKRSYLIKGSNSSWPLLWDLEQGIRSATGIWQKSGQKQKSGALVVKVSAVRERGSSIVPEFRNKPHKK
jgi:hypothetical protein